MKKDHRIDLIVKILTQLLVVLVGSDSLTDKTFDKIRHNIQLLELHNR